MNSQLQRTTKNWKSEAGKIGGRFIQRSILTKTEGCGIGAKRIQTMNQPPKDSLNTVDGVIDDILAEMPLDDRVRTANLDEDGLLVLQLALGKYFRHLLKNQSEDVNRKLFKDYVRLYSYETMDDAEAASYILKELWERLKETHKLRVVK